MKLENSFGHLHFSELHYDVPKKKKYPYIHISFFRIKYNTFLRFLHDIKTMNLIDLRTFFCVSDTL